MRAAILCLVTFAGLAGLGDAAQARSVAPKKPVFDAAKIDVNDPFALNDAGECFDPDLPDPEGNYYPVYTGCDPSYALARDWYQRAAAEGSTTAWYHLGNYAFTGHGEPRDYGRAMQLYRKAGDNSLAQEKIGLMFDQGLGVAEDDAEAMRWYERSEGAYFVRAVHYFKGTGVAQDRAKAFGLFGNDGSCKSNLAQGYMLFAGDGTAVDYDSAMMDFAYAANCPDGAPAWSLAENLHPQNFAEAWLTLRRKAGSGEAAAQEAVGVIYADSDEFYPGVEYNASRARRLLDLAAAQGNGLAHQRLGQMEKARRKPAGAFAHFKAAAEAGLVWSQYETGLAYENADGVAQDYGLAAEWYEKAARQGSGLAAARLGGLLLDEKLHPADPDAIMRIQADALAGSALAQYELAKALQFGDEGLTPDLVQARAWYEKAAAQGQARAQSLAMTNLALMLRDGLGGAADPAAAQTWLQRAAVTDPRAELALGHDESAANLGEPLALYARGKTRYAAGDYTLAADDFRRAAEQGHDDARHALGLMYLLGQGVERSDDMASDWYQATALRGDSALEQDLGPWHHEPSTRQRDVIMAVHWLTLAAEGKDGFIEDAHNRLAHLYADGKLVPVNWSMVDRYSYMEDLNPEHVKNLQLEATICEPMVDRTVACVERLMEAGDFDAPRQLLMGTSEGPYIVLDSRTRCAWAQRGYDHGAPWAAAILGSYHFDGQTCALDRALGWQLSAEGLLLDPAADWRWLETMEASMTADELARGRLSLLTKLGSFVQP